MSGFSIAWLDLREPADLRARNPELARMAAQWLCTGAGVTSFDPVVVDLGAGTGSTLRAFDTYAGRRCIWRLVDHDGDLLDEALRRHGAAVAIEDYQADLGIIAELPLTGARLITASALFDLASQDYLDKLVGRITGTRRGQTEHVQTGLYAALNYDGTTTWLPAHPLDTAVLDAFNRDQRRDKGFGPALGPDAAGALQMVLRNARFSVYTGNSPWQLGPQDQALICELVRGIASAVSRDYGLPGAQLQDWEDFRLAHAADGSCTVGHVDVLALPGPASD